jgi:hypothetical protein
LNQIPRILGTTWEHLRPNTGKNGVDGSLRAQVWPSPHRSRASGTSQGSSSAWLVASGQCCRRAKSCKTPGSAQSIRSRPTTLLESWQAGSREVGQHLFERAKSETRCAATDQGGSWRRALEALDRCDEAVRKSRGPQRLLCSICIGRRYSRLYATSLMHARIWRAPGARSVNTGLQDRLTTYFGFFRSTPW